MLKSRLTCAELSAQITSKTGQVMVTRLKFLDVNALRLIFAGLSAQITSKTGQVMTVFSDVIAYVWKSCLILSNTSEIFRRVCVSLTLIINPKP